MALIFGVYIIGHGIALLSSMFIEQFVHRTFGPPSKIITRSLISTGSSSAHLISNMSEQIKATYTRPSSSDLFRLIFHIPALHIYLVMYLFRLLGFYESKISGFVITRVQRRLEQKLDYADNIISNSSWFKIVEYACANDHAAAMGKMYNYLMIYGLFRSTSFLILSSMWCEVYFWLFRGGLGFMESDSGNMAIRFATLSLAYWVSFVGYGKFSRRYAEEAVQAFALSEKFN
ncbi:hypothetical protein MOP88_10735 [Sphingomonas sp. WKB10]|nr:hypothetical protein [Sphingomonas sp. WKB10]